MFRKHVEHAACAIDRVDAKPWGAAVRRAAAYDDFHIEPSFMGEATRLLVPSATMPSAARSRAIQNGCRRVVPSGLAGAAQREYEPSVNCPI